MKDRQSTYPNRITLTPVPGQAHTYDWARADQPTEEGTLLNKANLLSDDTAALGGLNSEIATPDTAFNKIFNTLNGLNIKDDGTVGGIMVETDPTVPAWAKAASKPTYTANEVGATPISGGTMTGTLTAYNNTTLSTSCVRNISIYPAASVPTSGANGAIVFGYE